MIFRLRISDFFYFIGASALIVTGIVLKSTAASGIGIYILYSGGRRVSLSEKNTSSSLKINLLWDLIFLAISVLMIFSLFKVILNIFLHREIVIVSQWIIIAISSGVIYFETLFRITGDKRNRFAVLLLMILLVSSAASLILGEPWLKTDLLLGFLSLTFTVIISFRKAYLELSDLLLQ